MSIKLLFHALAIISGVIAGGCALLSSHNRLVLFVVFALIAGIFELAISFLGLVPDNKPTSRPLLYIKPNKIEYSNWSEREKLDDPEITSRCEKIILYFGIHNNSKSPASNVDIKVTSSILQEKYIDKFTPLDIKNSYGHNLHLITEETPGRQPFILGLDKKFVKYFNDGTIKVKLIVNVKYNGLNDGKEHWSESAFIYSPTFEKQKEIYSRGD